MTAGLFAGWSVAAKVFGFYLASVSALAFLMYGMDKFKAVHGYWRTRESYLLAVGFFGGAAGALLAMIVFHHKTRHGYFWVINLTGLVLQAALFAYCFQMP